MASREKVAILISKVTRPVAFEWIAQSYLAQNHEVHFVLLHHRSTPFEENLRNMGVSVYFYPWNSWGSFPRVLWQLWRLFRQKNISVVHTHLLEANLTGLLAGFLALVPRRIHTRHHSDPYHYKHRHARFYDIVAAILSTRIIAASDNVIEVLRDLESVPEEKIVKIPFGLIPEEFEPVSEERKELMRKKYQIEGSRPLIGMVARYLDIKGLQYALPAFERILQEYPKACLLIANAVGGEYEPYLRPLLSRIPKENIREIAFEADMPCYYQLMDVFVHIPTTRRGESFGQSYTESMASGLPCVFTLSGVAPEFVKPGVNALVVPFADADATYKAIARLLKDKILAENLGRKAKQDALAKFSFAKYLDLHDKVWRGQV